MQKINVFKIGTSTLNLYGNNCWQLIFPFVMCWYIKNAPVKAKSNTVKPFAADQLVFQNQDFIVL